MLKNYLNISEIFEIPILPNMQKLSARTGAFPIRASQAKDNLSGLNYLGVGQERISGSNKSNKTKSTGPCSRVSIGLIYLTLGLNQIHIICLEG